MVTPPPDLQPPLTETKRAKWETIANWPLTAAALLFLAAYSLPIIFPTIGKPWDNIFDITTTVTWALFLIDYIARLGLSKDKKLFFKKNIIDLIVVVLPLFRPLRLLRLLTLLNVLNRYTGNNLHGKFAMYIGGSSILILFVASTAMLQAERGHTGASIQTFGNAIWWSITTITTVGYGDLYPVTLTGKLIAIGLMLSGVALLGTITASIASWLISKIKEEAVTQKEVRLLAQEIKELRQKLTNNGIVNALPNDAAENTHTSQQLPPAPH